jgi:hypothetical protein
MDRAQHNCDISSLLSFQLFHLKNLLGTESTFKFIIVIRNYCLGWY